MHSIGRIANQPIAPARHGLSWGNHRFPFVPALITSHKDIAEVVKLSSCMMLLS